MKLKQILSDIEFITEIKEKNSHLSKFSYKHAKHIYEAENGILLSEFVNKSINFSILKRELEKIIPNSEIEYLKDMDIFSVTCYEITEETYNFFLKKLNSFGWFIGNISNTLRLISTDDFLDILKKQKEIKEEIVFSIEPKFDTIIDNSKIETLYHISFDIFHKNILKQGLIPKNKNKLSEHPSRIYLLMNVNDQDIKALARSLWFMYKNKDLVKTVYVYKIDVGKMSGYKFMEDMNLRDGGVYTEDNIWPSSIEVHMTGKVDSKFNLISWKEN